MTREEKIKAIFVAACPDGFDPSKVRVELGGTLSCDSAGMRYDGAKVQVLVFATEVDLYECTTEVPFGAIEALVKRLKPESTRVSAEPSFYEDQAILSVVFEGCAPV